MSFLLSAYIIIMLVPRLTKRWEASLWVNRKQLYLGGYNDEASAARAYDMAALFCKGDQCLTNFPPEDYAEEMKAIDGFSRVFSLPSKATLTITASGSLSFTILRLPSFCTDCRIPWWRISGAIAARSRVASPGTEGSLVIMADGRRESGNSMAAKT